MVERFMWNLDVCDPRVTELAARASARTRPQRERRLGRTPRRRRLALKHK